ncbi:MAG: hypothetical protein ACI8QS_002524 [Planctomycetota bacterium]|jgi:hypothetical protein
MGKFPSKIVNNRAMRIGIAVVLLAVGCAKPADDSSSVSSEAPTSSGQPWFEDHAQELGLHFTHKSGAQQERYLMPETITGGAALTDLDGDGDLDVYFVQGGDAAAAGDANPGNQLFENTPGGFRDATENSGADDHGYGMGVAAGDVNGDGKIDLFVTNLHADTLLMNRGDLSFRTAETSSFEPSENWNTSAAFVDIDLDGDLDLYVAAYIDWSLASEVACTNRRGIPDYCSPKTYKASAPDTLFVNQGDGSFRDESDARGVRSSRGNGLGVGCADFDMDGWPDIFVANDGTPDFLWHNMEGLRFEELATPMGCATSADGTHKAGMGVAIADVDGDLDSDILVCNLASETDSLHLNEGTYFREGTAQAGLASGSRAFTRFGLGLIDFNNDGHLDIYQANGRVEKHGQIWGADPYAEPNMLLKGRPGPRFDIGEFPGGTRTALYGTSRAAAFGDVNGDGAVDILVVNRDAAAHLLINQAPNPGSFLLLRVLDGNGLDAIGAQVFLESGDFSMHREVRTAYSYLASNDPRVHFGLGHRSEIESVRVRFLDGEEQEFGPLETGREHVLRRR